MGTTQRKTTKKAIDASIWLSKTYPITMEAFFPLLHVLSFSSKQIAKFRDYLHRYQIPKNTFPLKAKVPLFMTMKATFQLCHLVIGAPELRDPSLFTVD